MTFTIPKTPKIRKIDPSPLCHATDTKNMTPSYYVTFLDNILIVPPVPFLDLADRNLFALID